MIYVYRCNGLYFVREWASDDPKMEFVAAWPGDLDDGPPAVLDLMRTAYWVAA